MSEFLCPFCMISFSCDLKVLHVLPCYRTYMKKNNAVPYCTCNHCKASRTHPGDQVDGSYRLMKNEEDEEIPLTRKHDLPPTELPPKKIPICF